MSEYATEEECGKNDQKVAQEQCFTWLRGKWETGTTKLGARAECDCTVCTQLQCIMSNNVVVVSKSDAGVDMKGLGFKL